MTTTEYRKNYREIVKKTIKMLRKYEQEALKSKAFDLEGDPSSYRTPKNVLTAALLDITAQWDLRNTACVQGRANAKEVENIRSQTYNWNTP